MRSQTRTVGSILDPTAQIKADQFPSSLLAMWHHLTRWIRSDPTAQKESRPKKVTIHLPCHVSSIQRPQVPRVALTSDHPATASLSNFADMDRTGERIEATIKNNEVENANVYSTSKNFTISQPQSTANARKTEERALEKEKEKMAFTPIPMSYAELYAQLHKADMVRPYIVSPYKPPFPAWYNEKVHCDYHNGVPGHSIEDCLSFKKMVQHMIKVGTLQIDTPNVAANPLPNHADRGVNVIEEVYNRGVKEKVADIKSPLRWVFQQLCMARLIEKGMEVVLEGCGAYCEFHQKDDHDIQHCEEFKVVVQRLMDNKEIQFFEKAEERKEWDVCTASGSKIKYGVNRPFIISARPKNSQHHEKTPRVTLKLRRMRT
ncbi:hypothetical protein GQ457_18G008790 [Hibiscus cannabinus]